MKNDVITWFTEANQSAKSYLMEILDFPYNENKFFSLV